MYIYKSNALHASSDTYCIAVESIVIFRNRIQGNTLLTVDGVRRMTYGQRGPQPAIAWREAGTLLDAGEYAAKSSALLAAVA